MNVLINGNAEQHAGGAMVSTIILTLALLTAGAIVGVFVLAWDELKKIDSISQESPHSG
ncbi:MAG TPA: hypothetical protein VJ654_05050 [Noviherbaspirillum sp.]|nr:hypothetical protein [Noviherbaspirillum sp.]